MERDADSHQPPKMKRGYTYSKDTRFHRNFLLNCCSIRSDRATQLIQQRARRASGFRSTIVLHLAKTPLYHSLRYGINTILTQYHLIINSELEMEHVDSAQCAYDLPNQLLFDYHVFSTVTLLPVLCLLYRTPGLRRLYLPLARLVDAALLARMFSAALFFYYYPYETGSSNCPEIILSKLTTIVEMFAELHQVYFIGFVLGIGNFNACMTRYFSLSLVQLLQLAFFVMVIAILVSFYSLHSGLSFVEDSCTVFVAVTQLYVIHLAETVREDHLENCIVSVRDAAIAIFKNLSIIQLFLSVISLGFRVYLHNSSDPMIASNADSTTSWMSSVRDAGSVMLAVDYFCTYMFYIKVILVREKSKNIIVDIV
jgi:hypothetical protein